MSDKPSPYSYRVKSIKKIIDGDTFDCIMDLGFDVLLEARVRMMGIDTPESRTRDLEEKKFGLLAKEYLTEKLDTEDIIVTTEVDNEKGKFGRILGWVWCNGVNINNQMIDEHMAVAYHGQSKDDIEQQHLANRTILQEQGKV
jgi:micrococcal nuclease|tara:strand:+ start:301 stop:729 length:429 start_codon:yes stop_codon:yes gene_type:complete